MFNIVLDVVWRIELYKRISNLMIVDGLIIVRFAFVLTSFSFLGPK